MANIKINGLAAVVTSGVKVSTIETLRKFKPEGLKLIDPETKDEIFAASMGTSPSFTNFGVVFNSKNDEGFAQLTLQLPTSLKDSAEKKQYVKDTYGYALLNLNKLEAHIEDTMETVAGDFTEVEAAIEA